ncbi:MAG TPA: endonuclease/exonuclease/phosphatase family protein, partial [Gemmataceae bacterium]|nr:endonuclease/exonuclease/phosphatase family protein [Gemmataceae bacterium]
MASRRDFDHLVRAVVPLILKYPKVALTLGGIVVVVLLVAYLFKDRPNTSTAAGSAPPGTYLLCSWNVENFFDDRDDANIRDDSDDWFGTDPAAFRQKVDHLATGLLLMNGGAGPDIACLVEVENERCLEALRDAVNAKLDAAGLGDKKYTHIVFRQDNTGRHFAPGILTRLPVVADRTRKLGGRSNGRILEGHITANGHDLAVIVAHWTSRVTDDKEEGTRRLSYANDCYGRVREIVTANPDADVLLCGDFNDNFRDRSLQEGLRATDNTDDVKMLSDEPRLLALFAGWKGGGGRPPGTIYHNGSWSVFDHICVTRGLLDDAGWT